MKRDTNTINLGGAWTSAADASKGLIALGSGFQGAAQAGANLHAAFARFSAPCSAMNEQRQAALHGPAAAMIAKALKNV